MFWWKKSDIKRFLRYTFFVCLILWIITSIFIIYKYVWFSSNTINTKGWTFVEWIFDSTSYLPYLRNDLQSYFYQWLLFNACLKSNISSWWIQFIDEFCSISTKDDKSFVVSFNKWNIRSDWTPVSLEDILFTYKDIIIWNKRWIKNLSIYKDITIDDISESSFNINFPTKSIDNKIFFTNYILPKHILKDYNFQSYREVFSVQPTYTNCANIVSQTTDQYSLIFNLVNCSNTNLNFYQIKSHPSFESFSNTMNEKKYSIVDAFISNDVFSWYSQYNLQTNKIITLFFNTNSDKLRVRTRRSLWWFIKHNFYNTWYQEHLIKNNDGLFDVFLSTWLNIEEFLDLWYNSDIVLKKDLIDSSIKPFSGNLSVNWENQKFVFYTENDIKKTNIIIELNTTYNKVAIEYNNKEYDWKYSDKKAEFTIGSSNNTFSTGLNKYTIIWRINNKKTNIATIDIYNIAPQINNSWNKNTISIIYYDDNTHDYVIENLKEIFDKNNISNYFSFEPISSLEEYEGKLLLNEYDIIVNTIDMGLRRDITRLFVTDSVIKNPSQYQNTKLISLLQQYTKSSDQKILREINDIYSRDMPFVTLWKEFVPLQLKSSIKDKLLTQENLFSDIYEYNRRNIIYKNLQLVNTVHIDWKRVFDYDNFTFFIKDTIGKKESNNKENTEEDENTDIMNILNVN
jgi:hypothetical protein